MAATSDATRPRRSGASRAWAYGALILGALLMVYPLWWMVMSSFKPDTMIFTEPNRLPGSLDFKNYVDGWFSSAPGFTRYYFNSFVICLGAVVGNVLACSLTAYAFARLEFPFKRVLFAIMMLTLMLPHHVVLIPQYILFVKLDWVNTYLPLIVPKFLATDAFFIFLMVQFIRKIPRELDEAAAIDGCGTFRTFITIIFPLLTPALVTTIIFTFIWTYNDFFAQLIYLTSPNSVTVPVALRAMIGESGGSYGQLLAMSVLSLVPTFVVFLIFQRRLVEGISTSGLKG
ncbi:carbohydrate ABC transporter permease (plasmid) [Rhizobium acidisoli]|uniref:Carbohydrate ABC transporter permease n=2 Tax=Rhizobium acidisoli TaxID=1538158 RepID=A0AAE6C4N1_9HYPH|nr:carbohydrate ABC transporter permease [Rhizobium acidisoli]KPH04781.1 sugar ABC transporter permease [Rhizobium acidisoli]QAS81915.1 carbohydrate ABC transporter permease [Rhizobium acidisoli]